MERLTKRSGEMVWLKKGELCLEPCEVISDCNAGDIRKLLVRMAAYEDTGLEPEEIETLQKREQGLAEMLVNVSYGCAVSYSRLAELSQAEKDGRLVILPCKVGDTVYATFRLCGDYLREKNKPYPCEVVFIGISNEPFIHIQFENGRIFPVGFEKIGETVFTTKEAAEAALKGQEG